MTVVVFGQKKKSQLKIVGWSNLKSRGQANHFEVRSLDARNEGIYQMLMWCNPLSLNNSLFALVS